MDISRLRECVDLASTLSFTQTAKRFYLSQPTLSNHITSVEKEIGAQIVLRTKNGLSLTPAGRIFVDGAESILRKYDDVLTKVKLAQSGHTSPIALGYLYGAVMTILPDAVWAFERAYEDVPIVYASLQLSEIPRAFDADMINMAITSSLLGFDDDIYVIVPIYLDGFSFIVPKDHHLASKSSVVLEDLAGEDVILSHGGIIPYETEAVASVLSPIEKTLNVRKRFSNMEDLKMMLLLENCGTVMFSHLKHLLGEDRFAFIPIEARIDDFHVCAV